MIVKSKKLFNHKIKYIIRGIAIGIISLVIFSISNITINNNVHADLISNYYATGGLSKSDIADRDADTKFDEKLDKIAAKDDERVKRNAPSEYIADQADEGNFKFEQSIDALNVFGDEASTADSIFRNEETLHHYKWDINYTANDANGTDFPRENKIGFSKGTQRFVNMDKKLYQKYHPKNKLYIKDDFSNSYWTNRLFNNHKYYHNYYRNKYNYYKNFKRAKRNYKYRQ